MDWNITYRNVGGELSQMSLEAGSREAVFEELARRGVSAVRVERAQGKAKPHTASPKGGNSSSGVFRGALAGVIVVVAAVGAWHFLCPKQATANSDAQQKRLAKISETASAPASSSQPVASKGEKPKPLPPQRIGETRDGKVLLPDGTLHTVKGVITSGVARVSLIDRTFKHDTDCMLAHLLTVKPGEGFVGDSESIYNGFEKEFLKAVNDPIVYDKDDSDYVKELKMGVQAMRQELLEIKAKGESIEKALIETRDQLQQLGLYRQELEQRVLTMSEDGMSQQDYDDLVSAANKMLEERGSEPLEVPSAVKHAVRLGRLMRESESKEKEIVK